MEQKMKTIGLIGGMSWESTVTYYQVINRTIEDELGGLHSAKILLYSVDFDEIERCQANNEWDKSAEILGLAAYRLQRAGADCIVICTNTMHKIAPQIARHVSVPLLHIAEATAEELKKANITKVALLGTKYTMTEDFYRGKIEAAGIEVMVPDEPDVAFINHVIYDELCRGRIYQESRDGFLDIIAKLYAAGAEGVILGCTEIGLLVGDAKTLIPLFDTTLIHARKAALFALGK